MLRMVLKHLVFGIVSAFVGYVLYDAYFDRLDTVCSERRHKMSAPVFQNAEQGAKLVAGNANFAWRLYQLLSKESGNVFFSPGSISIAMAMTYLGARNKTAEQMKQALGFSDVADGELQPLFGELHAALQSGTEDFTLHLANRLFAEQSFEFVQSFMDQSQKHYEARVAAVDFASNADGVRKEINDWVEENTAKKIQNLIPDGILDHMTKLVLVNAIYFKGNWKDPFSRDATKPDQFHVSATENVPVQMMYQQSKFKLGYQSDLNCLGLELPYLNNSMSMFVLLPAVRCGLAEVEGKLTDDVLHNFEQSFQMSESTTQVWMPKYKMEQNFDLNSALASLGMKDLFDQADADLTGMDARNQLFVSKVVHKAFIEVNEEGSEAAAATGVQIQSSMMPEQIKMDHPFLFFIRENRSKSILFFGRYSKP